jgi:hypothetical protein
MSGRLNVEDPFPTPYVTPITANRSAYVVRLTAEPSQMKYPLGAVPPANMIMEPTGGTGLKLAVPAPSLVRAS